MITSILNGELDNADFITHKVFGLNMPTSCPNVPSEILSPNSSSIFPTLHGKNELIVLKII